LARDSLNENSYAPKAKIQAFGSDCTQFALGSGHPDRVLRRLSNSQLHIGANRNFQMAGGALIPSVKPEAQQAEISFTRDSQTQPIINRNAKRYRYDETTIQRQLERSKRQIETEIRAVVR
jgi:hypothetical protein